jgi:hypothetical protein
MLLSEKPEGRQNPFGFFRDYLPALKAMFPLNARNKENRRLACLVFA